MKAKKRRMMAEWERQRAVQLTWPHEGTDWAPILPEITAVYEQMAREISQREGLVVVAPEGFAQPTLNSKLSLDRFFLKRGWLLGINMVFFGF